MIDKILVQTVNSVVKYFNSSAGKSMLNAATRVAVHAAIRETGKRGKLIEQGLEGFVEYVSSIQIKIAYKTKEAEVVIDAIKTQFYQVGNVNKSQVLQGQGNTLVINNFTFNVKLNVSSAHTFINSLREIRDEFKITEKMVSDIVNLTASELNEDTKAKAEKITERINQLSFKLSNVLSNMGIDYSTFEQIMKNKQEEKDGEQGK